MSVDSPIAVTTNGATGDVLAHPGAARRVGGRDLLVLQTAP